MHCHNLMQMNGAPASWHAAAQDVLYALLLGAWVSIHNPMHTTLPPL
jgi:hypothetical protein